MNILITAGPTREYLDPIRYISNESSGQMGFALATAAANQNATVHLISGPVQLSTPKNVTRLDVTSAEQMFEEVKKSFKTADLIICTAAVADWRPIHSHTTKFKKHGGNITIECTENPDILNWCGQNKTSHQQLVGFALETENIIENAKLKLTKKNCDWMIANSSNAINQTESQFTLLNRLGEKVEFERDTKLKNAALLMELFLKRR